jgi:hypothetical protein
MSNFWDSFKSKLGAIAASLIGLLAVLFFVEKKEKEDAEAKLVNATVDVKDKELADQQAAIEADTKQVQAQGEAAKAKEPSEQELIDFLNRNDE